MKLPLLRLAGLLTPALGLGLSLASHQAAFAQAPFVFDTPGATQNGVLPLKLSAQGDAAPAADAAKAKASDDWHFRLTLPLWVAGVSGDVAVKGREFSPSQDTGDAFDSLVSHLHGAGALHFEAEKSRFGVFVDAMYLDLRVERDSDSGPDPEVSVKQFIGELGGFYTVVAPKPQDKGWGAFRADALGGVRVTWMQLGLDTKVFDETAEKSIVDPFVGARAELGLTDWMSYKLRGDIGGFGVGSDLAWNIDTALEFHLSKCMDLDLGYRWLDYNFTDGSGGDYFKFDALISGPYIALQLRF